MVDPNKKPSRVYRFLVWLEDKLVGKPLHPLAKGYTSSGVILLILACLTAGLCGLQRDSLKGQAIYFQDNHLFTMPTAGLIPCYLGLAAFGNLGMVRTDLFLAVKRHYSRFRWIEMSFAYSLMSTTIMLLCDVDDITVVLLVMVIGWFAMASRAVIERDVAVLIDKKHKSNTLYGAVYEALSPSKEPDIDEPKENAPLNPSGSDSASPVPTPYFKPTEFFWASVILELLQWGLILPYYIDSARSTGWYIHVVVPGGMFFYLLFPFFLYRYQSQLENLGSYLFDDEKDPDEENDDLWEKAIKKYQNDKEKVTARTKADDLYESFDVSCLFTSLTTYCLVGGMVFVDILLG